MKGRPLNGFRVNFIFYTKTVFTRNPSFLFFTRNPFLHEIRRNRFYKVFIWNGKEASEAEKASSEGFAKKFLETDPRGRSIDTPIISENQGLIF